MSVLQTTSAFVNDCSEKCAVLVVVSEVKLINNNNSTALRLSLAKFNVGHGWSVAMLSKQVTALDYNIDSNLNCHNLQYHCAFFWAIALTEQWCYCSVAPHWVCTSPEEGTGRSARSSIILTKSGSAIGVFRASVVLLKITKGVREMLSHNLLWHSIMYVNMSVFIGVFYLCYLIILRR